MKLLLAAACLLSIGTLSAARADFTSCVAGLRSQAISEGISAAVFDRAMAGVKPDMDVIKAMNNQPEFKIPIWDYLGALVDEERVAEGRALLARHAATLAAAESRFGVDRQTIVAVWGVESNYGQVKGRWSLPQAL
ncbi:MAG: lytic murein transglycosylase, partial [Methylocystis sp.]|nr:lytic murein transglycosylase [Methylocystis sp.]